MLLSAVLRCIEHMLLSSSINIYLDDQICSTHGRAFANHCRQAPMLRSASPADGTETTGLGDSDRPAWHVVGIGPTISAVCLVAQRPFLVVQKSHVAVLGSKWQTGNSGLARSQAKYCSENKHSATPNTSNLKSHIASPSKPRIEEAVGQKVNCPLWQDALESEEQIFEVLKKSRTLSLR